MVGPGEHVPTNPNRVPLCAPLLPKRNLKSLLLEAGYNRAARHTLYPAIPAGAPQVPSHKEICRAATVCNANFKKV